MASKPVFGRFSSISWGYPRETVNPSGFRNTKFFWLAWKPGRDSGFWRFLSFRAVSGGFPIKWHCSCFFIDFWPVFDTFHSGFPIKWHCSCFFLIFGRFLSLFLVDFPIKWHCSCFFLVFCHFLSLFLVGFLILSSVWPPVGHEMDKRWWHEMIFWIRVYEIMTRVDEVIVINDDKFIVIDDD